MGSKITSHFSISEDLSGTIVVTYKLTISALQTCVASLLYTTQNRTGGFAQGCEIFYFFVSNTVHKISLFQASFESNTENTYTAGSLHKLQGCARPKPGVENPSEYPTKQ